MLQTILEPESGFKNLKDVARPLRRSGCNRVSPVNRHRFLLLIPDYAHKVFAVLRLRQLPPLPPRRRRRRSSPSYVQAAAIPPESGAAAAGNDYHGATADGECISLQKRSRAACSRQPTVTPFGNATSLRRPCPSRSTCSWCSTPPSPSLFT